MRLTILGSAGGWPTAGRACSGYLLAAGGRQVWLEAGTGTMPELLKHTTLADLDAVWISHLHADHCSDLLGALQALNYGSARDTRLPVYGPPDWTTAFEAFGPVHEVFEPHYLNDGDVITLGALELEAVYVPHMLPTFGVRASADGKVLAYTADYETGTDLSRFTDCDVLLAEAWKSSAHLNHPRLVLTHAHPDYETPQHAKPGQVIEI